MITAPEHELAALARALEERADTIVERWLELIAERPAVRPLRHFPWQLLRTEMPPVVRAVARELHEPGRLETPETIERLRGIACARFEAGVDIQELLGELEQLGQLMFASAAERIHDVAPASGKAAAALAALHQALARLATLTAGMQRELESAHQRRLSKRMRSFGRTVAHELKNPIGAAQGAAQLLGEGAIAGDPDQREHFRGMVLRNLERALHVIDHVRALSRLETPDGEEEAERAPLREVLESVQEDLAARAEERGVTIRIAEPVPDIAVDRSRVELALLNLVGNAIKYADEARDDRFARIAVSYRSGEEVWCIEVEDNGVGIPEDAQDRVFDRFYRARPGDGQGTGLGLAIAREAAEQMGGTVGFESTPGVGSTFYFTIPERNARKPPEPSAR